MMKAAAPFVAIAMLIWWMVASSRSLREAASVASGGDMTILRLLVEMEHLGPAGTAAATVVAAGGGKPWLASMNTLTASVSKMNDGSAGRSLRAGSGIAEARAKGSELAALCMSHLMFWRGCAEQGGEMCRSGLASDLLGVTDSS